VCNQHCGPVRASWAGTPTPHARTQVTRLKIEGDAFCRSAFRCIEFSGGIAACTQFGEGIQPARKMATPIPAD